MKWWRRYFKVQIAQTGPVTHAHFYRNIFTQAIYVFQFNCRPDNNSWNGTGYGWGHWQKL